MGRSLRIIVYGNAVAIVVVAIYFLILPAGIIVRAINDPGLCSARIPRFAFRWHHSLSPRIERWARQRVASSRATQLSQQNVSGTEWPVFSSVFYLWATEALQEAYENDPAPGLANPAQDARGAIEAVAALLVDPNHGTWVRKWWGDDYLKRENLFYRMLLIGGLTSYQRVSRENRYESFLRDQVDGLARELDESPFGLLDDYPGQCYPVDVLAAIAVIRKADQVLGTDHTPFVERARRGFEGTRLDVETGLPAYIVDSKTGEGQSSARGVGLAFMLSWAPDLWPETARQWYERYDRYFWQEGWLVAGIREFPRGDSIASSWMYDVDAGPVLAGYGTAASGFGIGAARANGRYDRAYSLGAEALVASWPLPNGTLLLPSLLSNLSDAPYTGEAGLLFSFTRKAPAAGANERYHLPMSVYLGVALYAGLGLALLAAAARRAKRWEKEIFRRRIPALNLQFGIWLSLIVTGAAAIVLSRGLVSAVLLLAAQLLPGTRR